MRVIVSKCFQYLFTIMMIHLLPNSFLNVHIFKDGQGVSIKVLRRILTNAFILMVVKLLYYTHYEERGMVLYSNYQ